MQEPFGKGQKGSSAMPHKRNPVVAERICGLARVVRAEALVGLENVALWHERDISHSSAERVMIPDAFLALDYMLDRFSWLVEGLVVCPEQMRRNLEPATGSSSASASCSRSSSRDCRATTPTGSCSATRCGAWEEELDFRELVRADDRDRGPRSTSTRSSTSATTHVTSTPSSSGWPPSPKGGSGSCLKRPCTSRAARSASSTSSRTSACCSSPATASRPSTSSCRPRSRTRGAC